MHCNPKWLASSPILFAAPAILSITMFSILISLRLRALLYCEPDTLSGYYWDDDGVLSFYRDHALSAHGAAAHG